MPETARIPDLLVERLALGEVGGPSAGDLAERFGVPADRIREQVAELELSSRAILSAYPAAQVRARVEARLAETRRPAGRNRVYIGLLASTAAAALLLLVWQPLVEGPLPQVPTGQHPANQWVVRSKGTPQLHVYRQRQGTAERLRSGGGAKTGDVVQLGYAAGDAQHGVVLSIDGWGQVTLHFPPSHTESTQLARKSTVLPYSFRLDAAPGFERFVFVTSDQPIDIKGVLEAAQQAEESAEAPLRLSDGVVSAEVVLRKDTKRELHSK